MSQNGNARHRVQRSEDERASLVDAWTRSGLSAQAFERQHGLSKSSLWRWQRACKLAPKKGSFAERSEISFAPVQVTRAEGPSVGERVVAEVMVGRDVRVRVLDGADASQVAQLVRALAGGLTC